LKLFRRRYCAIILTPSLYEVVETAGLDMRWYIKSKPIEIEG